MSTLLLLGPVVFQDFEVPTLVSFGGTQRLNIHRLPGGGRVVDALGSDDAQISFCGIFTGENAAERALALDALRIAGAPLPLTWDIFFYSVAIAEFSAEFCSPWWIPFRITCTVLQNATQAAVAALSSLAVDVQSDVATAAALPTGLDFSAAQGAVSVDDATVLGTVDANRAQLALAQTQGQVSAAMVGSSAQVGAISGANLLGVSSADEGIAALNTATSSAGQLAALSAADAYLGRAAVNLSNTST